MARIWESMWQGGKRQDLGAGYHYRQQFKQRVSSLVVNKGEIVRIHEKQDRSGRQHYPFYEGTYQHLSFHGV